MSRWAKVFSNAADSLPTAEEYEAESKSLRAEVDAEPPYVVAPLPPYDHDAACPKCRFAAGTTRYQRGYHEPCAIPESPWKPWLTSFGQPPSRTERLTWLRFALHSAAIPEHFERACPNCNHVWAEGLAGVGA